MTIQQLINDLVNHPFSHPWFILALCILGYLYFRKKGGGDFWFGLQPHKRVKQLIISWPRPKGSDCSHNEYRDSLYKYLRAHLRCPEKVVKESGSGRERIDIKVGEKVAIEIKANIKGTGEFQRLMGQVHTYGCDYIFVVLCGRSHDGQLVDRLFEEIEQLEDVEVIEK
jgi:hypothetical protein